MLTSYVDKKEFSIVNKMKSQNFCRPIINGKFEDKTCGEGPSLATMFDDDRHLQDLVNTIRVSH